MDGPVAGFGRYGPLHDAGAFTHPKEGSMATRQQTKIMDKATQKAEPLQCPTPEPRRALETI